MWGDFSSEGTRPRVWGDLLGRSRWKVPGRMRGTISQVVTVPRPSLGLRAAATVLTREMFFCQGRPLPPSVVFLCVADLKLQSRRSPKPSCPDEDLGSLTPPSCSEGG